MRIKTGIRVKRKEEGKGGEANSMGKRKEDVRQKEKEKEHDIEIKTKDTGYN